MITLEKHNESEGIRSAYIVESLIMPQNPAKLFLQTQECGAEIVNPTLTGGINAVSTSPDADSMRFPLEDGDRVEDMEIDGTTTTTIPEEEAITTRGAHDHNKRRKCHCV